MKRDEALNLLGLAAGAGVQEIEECFAEQHAEIGRQIRLTEDEALRAQLPRTGGATR